MRLPLLTAYENHRRYIRSGHAFVLSHRAQDYDYSHKDPSPSDCTEVADGGRTSD